MKDDIMPRILIYGEDGLTLKYTKNGLGEILHKLGDNSNPADCTIFYRPSFGRSQYGEFDAIIISQEKAYFVEAKWDENGKLEKIRGLEENQIRRHKIFEWFSQNWHGEAVEAWDRFAEKNNPEFKKEFTFEKKNGEEDAKYIPDSDTTLGQNLQNLFKEIGDKKSENVLLIFYKDVQPEVEQDGFTTVFVRYNPTLGLFTNLD